MKDNQRKLIYTAMFAAVVVVLQMFVSIPIGMFTITLTLVPIMLGAILFGPISGAILGGVFGVVVAMQVVTGAAGALSSAMFLQIPVITVTLCILKGAAAGWVSGIVYQALAKREKSNSVSFCQQSLAPLSTQAFLPLVCLFFTVSSFIRGQSTMRLQTPLRLLWLVALV